MPNIIQWAYFAIAGDKKDQKLKKSLFSFLLDQK